MYITNGTYLKISESLRNYIRTNLAVPLMSVDVDSV